MEVYMKQMHERAYAFLWFGRKKKKKAFFTYCWLEDSAFPDDRKKESYRNGGYHLVAVFRMEGETLVPFCGVDDPKTGCRTYAYRNEEGCGVLLAPVPEKGCESVRKALSDIGFEEVIR